MRSFVRRETRIVVVLLAVFGLCSCGDTDVGGVWPDLEPTSGLSPNADLPPAIGSRVLFNEKCSICHPTDRATSKQKNATGWQTTVMRMKDVNGAPITEDEAKAIIEYLAKTFDGQSSAYSGANVIVVTNYGKKEFVSFNHGKHNGLMCFYCHHNGADNPRCGTCHKLEPEGGVSKIQDAIHGKDTGACRPCHFDDGANKLDEPARTRFS